MSVYGHSVYFIIEPNYIAVKYINRSKKNRGILMFLYHTIKREKNRRELIKENYIE